MRGEMFNISCLYTGGDTIEIDIGKRELEVLSEYIMLTADAVPQNKVLDVVLSIIVGGAVASGCKLPSDKLRAFKKFMKDERNTKMSSFMRM